MEILTFSPGIINNKSFSSLIKKSFKGSEDAHMENWFSYDEMLANIGTGRGVCLFASDNGVICASVYAQTENPINGREGTEKWIINLLAVLPEYEGRGVGTKLIYAIEEHARNKGAIKIFVTTNEPDRPVQLFYMGRGYNFAGRVEDYQYGEGNTAMFFMKYL